MSIPDPIGSFGPVAAAISALLHPHAEVVLHDLSTHRIAGIWNAFSGRRTGDDSLIEDLPDGEPEDAVWGPYEKTGLRGERLQSVTAVLQAPEGGEPIGLMCINLDVSRLDDAQRLLAAFFPPRQPQPASLFRGDWREQIQTALHERLAKAGASVAALHREERIALIGELDRLGLFEARGAADHTAQLLGVARTSVYNYLRAARAMSEQPDTVT